MLVSFGIEILTLLWGPAKDASVPHLVPEEKLASANSLSLVASYGTFPLAAIDLLAALAVIAGWLGGVRGAGVAQGSTRRCSRSRSTPVTFVVSAIIVVGASDPASTTTQADQKFEWTSTRSREIKDGLCVHRAATASSAA